MPPKFINLGPKIDTSMWNEEPPQKDSDLPNHEKENNRDEEREILLGHELQHRFTEETRRQKLLATRNEMRATISFLIGTATFSLIAILSAVNPYISVVLEIYFPEIFGPNNPANSVLKFDFLIYLLLFPFVVSFVFSIIASVQSGVTGKILPRPLRWLSWFLGGGTS